MCTSVPFENINSCVTTSQSTCRAFVPPEVSLGLSYHQYPPQLQPQETASQLLVTAGSASYMWKHTLRVLSVPLLLLSTACGRFIPRRSRYFSSCLSPSPIIPLFVHSPAHAYLSYFWLLALRIKLLWTFGCSPFMDTGFQFS